MNRQTDRLLCEDRNAAQRFRADDGCDRENDEFIYSPDAQLRHVERIDKEHIVDDVHIERQTVRVPDQFVLRDGVEPCRTTRVNKAERRKYPEGEQVLLQSDDRQIPFCVVHAALHKQKTRADGNDHQSRPQQPRFETAFPCTLFADISDEKDLQIRYVYLDHAQQSDCCTGDDQRHKQSMAGRVQTVFDPLERQHQKIAQHQHCDKPQMSGSAAQLPIWDITAEEIEPLQIQHIQRYCAERRGFPRREKEEYAQQQNENAHRKRHTQIAVREEGPRFDGLSAIQEAGDQQKQRYADVEQLRERRDPDPGKQVAQQNTDHSSQTHEGN